jgi:two-component system cell cycle sensor histidine kinase/response regulator CckA
LSFPEQNVKDSERGKTVMNSSVKAGAFARTAQPSQGPGNGSKPGHPGHTAPIWEAIHVGYYRSTEQGQILEANPALIRMLGFPDLDTLREVNAADCYVNNEDRLRLQRQIKQEGVVNGFETQWRRYDGTSIWIRESAQTVWASNGQVAYFEGVAEDITQTKNTIRALRRRNRELALLSQMSQMAATSLDLQQVLTSVLQEVHHFMGLASSSIWLVDSNSGELICLGATGPKGDMVRGWRLPPGEGFVGWVAQTGQSLNASNAQSDKRHYAGVETKTNLMLKSILTVPLKIKDRVIGVLQVAHEKDTSFVEADVLLIESLAAASATAIENARLYEETDHLKRFNENIVQSMEEGILLTDPDGRISFANRSAANTLGWTIGELVGQPCSFVELCRESSQRPGTEDGPVQHQPNRFETTLATKAGEDVPVLLSVRPLQDNGTLTGFLAVFSDISELKQAEVQLRMQDRLAAIGRLAGGVAHDFNNVLMTIILYAELLLDDADLPSNLKSDVSDILEEATDASHLVRQILDFSRRSAFETTQVDLRELVLKSVTIHGRTLPDSVHLKTELGPEPCVARVDPTRIQQAVLNLVINAQDAMPEGGDLCLDVRLLRVKPGGEPPVEGMACGDWVRLGVSDTGSGIPAEVKSHLFEPFFTTKPPGEGTGLGLAQVYGIVAQHHGFVDVETAVGRGTAFFLYFPAVLEDVEPLVKAEPVSPATTAQETVLLVEDEERVRNLSQRVLDSLGYRVLTAANGKEAIAVYHDAQGIDLLLTDMMMPEMGGKELINRLREVEPGLKVVAMTGYVLGDDVSDLLNTEGVEFVYKPLNREKLAQVINRRLDGSKEPREMSEV